MCASSRGQLSHRKNTCTPCQSQSKNYRESHVILGRVTHTAPSRPRRVTKKAHWDVTGARDSNARSRSRVTQRGAADSSNALLEAKNHPRGVTQRGTADSAGALLEAKKTDSPQSNDFSVRTGTSRAQPVFVWSVEALASRASSAWHRNRRDVCLIRDRARNQKRMGRFAPWYRRRRENGGARGSTLDADTCTLTAAAVFRRRGRRGRALAVERSPATRDQGKRTESRAAGERRRQRSRSRGGLRCARILLRNRVFGGDIVTPLFSINCQSNDSAQRAHYANCPTLTGTSVASAVAIAV